MWSDLNKGTCNFHIKTKRHWLFWQKTYNGPHEFKPLRVKAYHTMGKFHIEYECVHCSGHGEECFVSSIEMYDRGYCRHKVKAYAEQCRGRTFIQDIAAQELMELPNLGNK